MANRIERLNLDVGKENVIEEAVIVQQGENISLTLEVDVLAYGEAFEVSENTRAYFLCARPDGTRIMADAEVVTRNPTFLTFDVPDAVCMADGTISLAYFLLSDAATGWKATTDYFQITVTTGILDAEPASDDGSVQALIAACEAMAEEFAESPNENRVEYLELDVNKENEVTELIVVQQGENISLTIEATVTESGRNLELSEGTNAYFLCAKPDGTNVIAKAAVLATSPTAVVSVDVPSSVCAADGTIQLAYFMFSEPSSKWVMTTDAFQIVVTRGIDMDGIESTDDYQNLVAMLDELSVRLTGYDAEWAGLKTDAVDATSAANSAAATATSAAAAALAAVSDAETAVQNANAAVDNANTAVANSNAATDRANEAAANAQTIVDNVNEYMTRAETAATGAEASRDAAASSESAAASSAVSAAASEAAAAASEAAAASSEAASKASASAAKTSETNAKTSETNAKASETAAKSSEVNAKSSEAAAKTSEANAKSSESSASAYAGAAASSESAAAASASEASSYAESAAASSTSAGQSATSASSSASAAAASASSASASAGNAASSESAAALSANSASSSKDAAYSYADSAAASAAAAEAAAEKAESIAGFTVDAEVTQNSTNPVASKAVYSYVTQMFADFTAVTFEIVDSYAALPATGAAGTFYFVPASSTGTNDMYSEYVWLNGRYEKFGDIQLPDLSPYAKMTWVTEQLSTQLASYYTKTEADSLLAGKQDVLTIDAVPTSGSSNPVQSGGVHSALATKADTVTVTNLSDTVNDLSGVVAGKQDALTFDSTPTAGSGNPVTSAGIKEYVDNQSVKIEYLSNAEFLALLGMNN